MPIFSNDFAEQTVRFPKNRTFTLRPHRTSAAERCIGKEEKQGICKGKEDKNEAKKR